MLSISQNLNKIYMNRYLKLAKGIHVKVVVNSSLNWNQVLVYQRYETVQISSSSI